MKPNSAIAASTLRRVCSLTMPGLLSTLETVPIATQRAARHLELWDPSSRSCQHCCDEPKAGAMPCRQVIPEPSEELKRFNAQAEFEPEMVLLGPNLK
jgi:hypothetical protein